MTKSLKIFIACFLGAGIGTLTALEINGYFWWLGLLVGGFVGYISYEFRLVLKACKNAWKAVVGFRITKEQWRSFFQWWVGVAVALTGGISLVISFAIGIGVLKLLSYKSSFFNDLCLICFVLGGIMVFAMFAGLLAVAMFEDGKSKEEGIEVACNFIYYNPFRIYFLIIPKFLFQSVKQLYVNAPKYLPKVIPVIRLILVTIAVTIYRFVKHVFIEIHSDERLLVGIDATIGTIIGFFAGSVLIGAISGGVFGVLNFEIISKRVLRLVPKNNA